MATQPDPNPVNAPRAEATRQSLFAPPADIYETNDAVHVLADMPGVTAENLDITVDDQVLTIRGKVHPAATQDHSLTYSEYETGDYERSFLLSDEIDRENIGARIEHGVLHLTLPKTHPTKRKIEVKTG